MPIYWIFLIGAVVIAIFADQISKAAKGNKRLKKWLIVICAGLGLISLCCIIMALV